MRLIDLWHGYNSSGTKIITRPHFTRKPLCKIKMCHAEGMGENEMFVLKVAIRKWGEVVLRYNNWVNTVQYYKTQHQSWVMWSNP